MPHGREPMTTFWDETKLQTLLQTVPTGIYTVDAKGTITSWNPAMERMTGIPSAGAVGRHCSVLQCSNCPKETESCPLFKKGSIADVECTITRPDGRVVYVLKNARVMRDGSDEAIGAVETLTDISALKAAREEVEEAREALGQIHGLGDLVGKNHRMQEIYTLIKQAAASNATVLITGESGTGKELAASAIHYHSSRRDKPFVKVNCSALSESLLESELFGHVRGAFTGAVGDKVGRFEAADGGTLLLDEIGEASQLIQLKLLRVLQEQEFERVGETRTRRVDVRVIASTNRDLRALMRQGKFREDLFYRLSVFPLRLPPLRDRKDDIPLLVGRFIEKFNAETGKRIGGLSHDAMRAVLDYCWPGNVRELENAFEHAFVTCESAEIDLFDLPQEIRRAEYRRSVCVEEAPPARRISAGTDRAALLSLLGACGWNKAEVARRLNISRTAVWKRMKKLGIPLQPES